MAKKFDVVLSQKMVFIQLRFMCDNQEILKPRRIGFEISKVTSNEFSFQEQMEAENQKRKVTTNLYSENTQDALGDTQVVDADRFAIPDIPLPSFSTYEFDTKANSEVSIKKKKGRSFISGQYLWIADTPNPYAEDKNADGCPLYLTGNTEITIYLTKTSAPALSNDEKVVNKSPLSDIVFVPKNNANQNLFEIVNSFDAFESNLFFLCVAQFHQQHSSTILEFTSKQIKTLLKYNSHHGNNAFLNKIDKAFDKFLDMRINLTYSDPKTGEEVQSKQQFFSRCDVYKDSLKVRIQYAPAFEELIYTLPNYTRFSIVDYVRINSRYSKVFYRKLMDWRTKGKLSFYVDNFKKLLNISDSYSVGQISQKIIKPMIIDLAPYFRHLRVEKEYTRNGKKTQLTKWTFLWDKESKNENSIIDPLLADTVAIYNIKTNPWLTLKQKFIALDKYRGQKQGTAQSMYEHAHPNTYFFTGKEKQSNNQFTRQGMRSVFDYSLGELAKLIKTYEKYNYEGALLAGDIKDLVLIEQLYARRELPLALKTSNTKHPNFPNSKIIAGQVIKETFFFDKKTGLLAVKGEVDARMSQIEGLIEQRVYEQHAARAEQEDNRDPAVKLTD